jgi:hypothetical protein
MVLLALLQQQVHQVYLNLLAQVVQMVQVVLQLLHQEHLVLLDQVVLQVQTVFLALQVQLTVLPVLLEHQV